MRPRLALAFALLVALVPSAAADLPSLGGEESAVADPVLLPSRPCQGPVDFGCDAGADHCDIYVEDPAGRTCVWLITFEELGDLLQCVQGPHPYMCFSS